MSFSRAGHDHAQKGRPVQAGGLGLDAPKCAASGSSQQTFPETFAPVVRAPAG